MSPPRPGLNGAYDLDAARRAAPKADAFKFTYQGETYEVPAARDWPLEAQELLGEGELAEALGMLLGKDTCQKLITAGITVGDLELLFDAIGEATGVGSLPNSRRRARRASTRT